ncbi:MAG: YbjN domain-containing protein [Bowdeniella nasicola]|nr:YbjN domain-containing protein [Bowdeniella nasicola]
MSWPFTSRRSGDEEPEERKSQPFDPFDPALIPPTGSEVPGSPPDQLEMITGKHVVAPLTRDRVREFVRYLGMAWEEHNEDIVILQNRVITRVQVREGESATLYVYSWLRTPAPAEVAEQIRQSIETWHRTKFFPTCYLVPVEEGFLVQTDMNTPCWAGMTDAQLSLAINVAMQSSDAFFDELTQALEAGSAIP